MLNFYKLIEILVSLQSLVITTMLPVYMPLQLINKSINSFEIPITWQIPTVILLTLIFQKEVILKAYFIYIENALKTTFLLNISVSKIIVGICHVIGISKLLLDSSTKGSGI